MIRRFAIFAFVLAIADAQSTDPIAIQVAMANIMDLDTVLGQFSFDADSDAVYDLIVLIVESGKLQVFE